MPQVDATGQGGLLGITLGPTFARDRLVFLSFAEPRGGGANATAVFRGRLSADGTALEGGRTIWRQDPPIASRLHFGSRLVFDRTGHLFVTTGERFTQMDQSQNPSNTLGKIVRITADGAPAGESGRRPDGTRRSTPSACATSRARRFIPRPAACGSATTGRAAATASMPSAPAPIMAGR